MATTAAGVKSPPSDALWVCVSADQLEIQELGKFAVMEQNKKHHWELTFNAVYEAWKMTMAANYGNLYLLHLTALKNGVMVNYQAVVWVQAEGYCGLSLILSCLLKSLCSEAPRNYLYNYLV